MEDHTLTVVLAFIAALVAIFLKPKKTVQEKQRQRKNQQIDDQADALLTQAEETHQASLEDAEAEAEAIDNSSLDELSELVNDEFDSPE